MGALVIGTESEALVENILNRSINSTRPCWKHFTTDNGAWYEGPGYWDYAVMYNVFMLAGLDTATSGNVFMDGREVAGPSLERGVVFQSHALMPWLTVRRNIAFAVVSRWPEWTKEQVNTHVEKFVAMVGLSAAIDKKPSQLSGGMKQRVGIARALAMEPKVLLMDEPFGALDALTRAKLQDELLEIVARTQSTVVMVTHDVDEAVLLSDKIVMLTNGPAAHVGEILTVSLPRPRKRLELVANSQYIRAREGVLKFLYERHHFVESAA